MLICSFLIRKSASQFCLKEKDNDYSELTEFLWNSNEDLIKSSLNTTIVKGIQDGNLNPDYYMLYTFQDIVYLKYSVDLFSLLETKLINDDKYAFMLDLTRYLYNSYKKYYDLILEQYKIPTGLIEKVTLNDTISSVNKYLNDLKTTIENEEPFYYMVAILPCLKLYRWLGDYLSKFDYYNNIYKSWIDANKSSDNDDYCILKVEDFLNQNSCFFDKKIAFEIFKNNILNEINVFNLI